MRIMAEVKQERCWRSRLEITSRALVSKYGSEVGKKRATMEYAIWWRGWIADRAAGLGLQ